MSRYSRLTPFTPAEQRVYSIAMLNFFGPMFNAEHREALGLPETPGVVTPLSILDFLKTIGTDGTPALHLSNCICLLAKQLELAGFLERVGGSDYYAIYSNRFELTNKQRLGTLFLGRALGLPFIADQAQRILVHVVGTGADDRKLGGTGIQISTTEILTCAHVVEDMQVDEVLTVNGHETRVQKTVPHPSEDVAIIYLAAPAPPPLADMAFRPARLLEDVLICGFPPIPYAAEARATYHRGEIAALSVPTCSNVKVDLFTAVARPGNSGGPLLTPEGHIVGIVTQRLEAQVGKNEVPNAPFFAAVPAERVREAVRELSGGETTLPWEDYQ
ncbi:trypsin-like peptidase domain-containing protein [Rhizobium sp. CFBP 13726]|uniref:S1 family peptidase n=1 Tax=Rhizobium sp. CFBP 13726 TaxID=2775296 RepID=UPI00177F0F57|nr:serine protease [Rhizobium sp. CFBP 13726]MBD8650841.1 trypsin-like peptidase domain-containing protein [Rhizobium sp. CFBP 13726]